MCVCSVIVPLQQMTWGTSTIPMSMGSLGFFFPVCKHHLATFVFWGRSQWAGGRREKDGSGVRPALTTAWPSWLRCGAVAAALSLCFLVLRKWIIIYFSFFKIISISMIVVGLKETNICVAPGTDEVLNRLVPFILYFLSFVCLEKSPFCPPKT